MADKPHYGRGQHPNSRKNLEKGKPFQAGEERTRKAGGSSGAVRGAWNSIGNIIITLLNEDDDKLKNLLAKRILKMALDGNLPAIQYVVKLIGEEPAENINISTMDFSALDRAFECLDGKDSDVK